MKLIIHDFTTGNLHILSLTKDQAEAYEGKPSADLKNHPDIQYELQGLGLHHLDADVFAIENFTQSTHHGREMSCFASKTRNL